MRRHNGIYSPLVILWLLVWQRLGGGAPLETAVLELLRGLPASFWPLPCKRMQEWREQGKTPSSNTGAYNQARQALPLSLVQNSCDRIFEGLVNQFDGLSPQKNPRAFLLDGSTIRAAHTPTRLVRCAMEKAGRVSVRPSVASTCSARARLPFRAAREDCRVQWLRTPPDRPV